MEHLSQAFTAPPFELSDPPQTTPRHKINSSVDSTSSNSSLSRLKRFTESLARSQKSPKSAQFKWGQRVPEESVFKIKGSEKTFRKEDIKLGELTGSSNMLHCI
jgi:hypothetical protein